ncbi:hypothetical protein BI364_10105 [Acidihalobacter yilgarnensis]|uniref:Uncharacterized protein n=1 Tax=Acidihalobacter yilgarnensis TaxID=2819280 RepID=A0A1D8IPD0_9GAMM|nr:hypothetical protein [Acidihalobacter yilgarnensis]AOU98265.1 hypothetical protein BI364_10105 [Acidihalobacter yilgarnensis]
MQQVENAVGFFMLFLFDSAIIAMMVYLPLRLMFRGTKLFARKAAKAVEPVARASGEAAAAPVAAFKAAAAEKTARAEQAAREKVEAQARKRAEAEALKQAEAEIKAAAKNRIVVDTTPGKRGAFAPPAGFAGDYTAHMCARWQSEGRQSIEKVVNAVRRGKEVHFSGAYAEEAAAIVSAIIHKTRVSLNPDTPRVQHPKVVHLDERRQPAATEPEPAELPPEIDPDFFEPMPLDEAMDYEDVREHSHH